MRDPVVIALTALGLLLGAEPLRAAAWPREPGAVFVSQRIDYDRSWREQKVSASLYAEYGLSRRFTLAGEISNADEPWTISRAGVGLRYALNGDDAANRFALSLGVSTPPTIIGMMTETRIETGLHWGRGFESRLGGGWASASARVLIARDQDRPITDVFALVGVRPAERWMTMLSASRYADDGGTYYKLTPSLGYEMRDDLWLVPSVTQEFSDDRSTSVGLAVWFSF